MLLSHSTQNPKRNCLLQNCAVVPYSQAWDYQRSLVEQRKQNPNLPDVLLLLEHPPTYTLGTGATEAFLKFDRDNSPWEIHRIERGGEVTYHCPGQLVSYPILNLRYHQQDLHWYLRELENVLIEVIKNYDLPATRIPGLTGVWIKGVKVGAIGVKVSRWITMHGFSLNINPDLSGFQHIVPCGISDKPVGSLSQFLPNIELKQVREDVAHAFARRFQLSLSQSRCPLI